MGRPRKFQTGDIALWVRPRDGFPELPVEYTAAVITDYRQDTWGRGEYQVVRVAHPLNGQAYGDTVWVAAHLLLPLPYTARLNTVRVVKANDRLVERGCACNCCPHEAIPREHINADGTFTWD